MESTTAGNVMSSRLVPGTCILRLFNLVPSPLIEPGFTHPNWLAIPTLAQWVLGQAAERFTIFCHHCDLDWMEHIAAMTQKLGIRIWITLAPQVFGSSIRTFLI